MVRKKHFLLWSAHICFYSSAHLNENVSNISCLPVVITRLLLLFCVFFFFFRNVHINIESANSPFRSKTSGNEAVLVKIALMNWFSYICMITTCYLVKVRDYKEDTHLNYHLLTVSNNLMSPFVKGSI